MPGELLEEQGEAGVADGLCGLDPFHFALEGGPAHALGLVDGISDATIRSEALAALECLADGPIIGALTLATVGEAMSLAGGEDPASCRLVEFSNETIAPGADPPPTPTTKGLRRGRQLNTVVVMGLLAGPAVGRGVAQPHPAALLAHVSLIADAGDLPSAVNLGPDDGAAPCAGPEEAVADELVEVEHQAVLDGGSSAAIAAAVSAHGLARLSEISCLTHY